MLKILGKFIWNKFYICKETPTNYKKFTYVGYSGSETQLPERVAWGCVYREPHDVTYLTPRYHTQYTFYVPDIRVGDISDITIILHFMGILFYELLGTICQSP